MKKVLSDYIEVKNQIKTLQEKEGKLRDKILSDFSKNGIKSEKTVYGTFTASERVNWEYSDELKAKVLKMQKKEKAEGVAKEKVSHYLSFTPKKD